MNVSHGDAMAEYDRADDDLDDESNSEGHHARGDLGYNDYNNNGTNHANDNSNDNGSGPSSRNEQEVTNGDEVDQPLNELTGDIHSMPCPGQSNETVVRHVDSQIDGSRHEEEVQLLTSSSPRTTPSEFCTPVAVDRAYNVRPEDLLEMILKRIPCCI